MIWLWLLAMALVGVGGWLLGYLQGWARASNWERGFAAGRKLERAAREHHP